MAISTGMPIEKGRSLTFRSLVDLQGFTDLRYSVLCIGGFFAQLGQWIPSYYISMSYSRDGDGFFLQRAEMYTNAAYPGNGVSEYFLPMMNGGMIIGAVS
jgi:MCP family monocarboxylic acid transporter-like MFS transporter 10